jgi:hypothetical protein
MAKISVEEARELARKAREWTAADRAKETIDGLAQEQQVDPQKLSEPFTV